MQSMEVLNNSKNDSLKETNFSRYEPGLHYNNVYHTILIILAVAIVFHNSLVIHLYRKTFSLKSHTNYLLVNLACSDLLTGLLVIPLIVLSAVYSGRDGNIAILYFAANVAGDFVTVLIIFALTAVTLERYLCLSFPFRYEVLIEKGRIKCLVVLIWLFAFIVSFLPICWAYKMLIGHEYTEEIERNNLIHSFFLLVVCFIQPALVMLFAQISMFRVVRRLNSNEVLRYQRYSNGGKEERKVFIIFMVMYVGLLLCWTPLISLRIQVDTGTNLQSFNPILPEFLFACRCWTSLFNPVLYVWCKTDFKAAFLKRFRNSTSHSLSRCQRPAKPVGTDVTYTQVLNEMSTKV